MSDGLQLSSQLRCGLMLAGSSREQILTLARGAEEAGFDSLWVGDHVSFHIPILESITLLSFVAGVTERIELGTGVYLLPLRHPTLTAKTTSTLDRLSNGRLVLGVGVGGEFPPEFDATGVPVRERGSRADESIEVLRRLWSENQVRHEGRHFRFGPVSLNPKPLRSGGPPIVVGGRKAASMRRAGRLGDGYISHMCSADQYRDNLASIAEHARAAGRAGRDFESAALIFTALDPSYERALDRAADTLGTIYARDFREAAAKYCLLGRSDDCLEQIERFARAGVRHFLLSPLGDPGELQAQVAEELLPRIRSFVL